MPTTELEPVGIHPTATPIHTATLLDVVLKSQGTARLKRRVASRLIFSQITVDQYISDREGTRERLLSVPVFGSSSLIELELVLASFVESQVISVPTSETPYRLPDPIAGLTISGLLMETILPPTLTRLIQSSPNIGSYRIQSILDDRWAFRDMVQRTRSVGKAKAATIDAAIMRFVDDVKAITGQTAPSREYLVYSAADLLTPIEALEHCLDRLSHPQNIIVRDRYRVGQKIAEVDSSMLGIAKKCGMSRYACANALKLALAKLAAGPSYRAARRLLSEPLGVAARSAAAKVLKAPVKDAQIENYLRDEPYLRLAVVIAHKRPNEWIGKQSSG